MSAEGFRELTFRDASSRELPPVEDVAQLRVRGHEATSVDFYRWTGAYCDSLTDDHVDSVVQWCQQLVEVIAHCARNITDHGIGRLAGLPKLQRIKMVSLPATTDFGVLCLANAKELKDIQLMDMRYVTDTAIGWFRENKALSGLCLAGVVQVTNVGIGYVSEMENLVFVDLNSLPLVSDVSCLAVLPKLKHLKLINLVGLTDANLSTLAEVRLEFLALHRLKSISDASVGLFADSKTLLTFEPFDLPNVTDACLQQVHSACGRRQRCKKEREQVLQVFQEWEVQRNEQPTGSLSRHELVQLLEALLPSWPWGSAALLVEEAMKGAPEDEPVVNLDAFLTWLQDVRSTRAESALIEGGGEAPAAEASVAIAPADPQEAIPQRSEPSEAPLRASSSKLVDSRWVYRPTLDLRIGIRAEPSIDARRTGSDLGVGEVFSVSEELSGPDDVLYLRLADGRGWVFDRKSPDNVMCVRWGPEEDPTAKADKAHVLARVARGLSLDVVAISLLEDRDLAMAAISRSGWALASVPPAIQADKEMVLAAVGQVGRSLEFAADELKADIQVVLAAIAQDPRALHLAADTLQSNPEVLEAARRSALQRAMAASRHRVRFEPKRGYREGGHAVASFPGVFGAIWDLLQGQLSVSAFEALQGLGMTAADASSVCYRARASGGLSTTCVFLPPGSEEFGRHEEVDAQGCWCNRLHVDGGLEYTVGGRFCREEEFDKANPQRTTFGCEWYRVWKNKVAEAHMQGCKLYVVVPDGDFRVGNSQRGEIVHLRRVLGSEPERIKLSAFLRQVQNFL